MIRLLLAVAVLALPASAQAPVPLEPAAVGAAQPFEGAGLGDPASQEVPSADFPEIEAEGQEEEGVPADLLERGGRWSTSAQLARLVPAPRGQVVSFVVLGDVEPGRFFWSRWLFNKRGVFKKQLERIALEPAAFVIQLGDMVSRGIPRNYRRFYDDLEGSGLGLPYLTAIGNHDRLSPHGESPALIYETLFGRPDYSFDMGDARFVVLDSSEERLTEGQLAWLDLALDTDRRKLVFTHMPPVSFKGWTLGMTGIKAGEQRFLEILSRRGVDRVYVGHIHGFGIAERGGVRWVLSGGGGSPLYPLPTDEPKLFHHYLTVTLAPGGLMETVHPLEEASFPVPWPEDRRDFERMIVPPIEGPAATP